MSKFVPSPYQQAIYDFITDGNGNAVVSAVAGSGKTTTLIKAINLIPKNKNVIFLAFNKSIAGEIRERIPQGSSNIEVKTVHSYGYSSIQKSFSCEIENGKYRKILNDIILYHQTDDMKILDKYAFDGKSIKWCMDFAFQNNEAELVEDKVGYFNRVVALCDLGRLNLIDLKNLDNGIDQLSELAKKHDLTLVNGECFRAWLLINIGASYTFKVDFTDMVFLPIHYKIETVKYDIVFIDECQDLNSCQRELMKQAMKPKIGRFVAVGDEKQAIYGFAGADASSFNKLKDIPNTITLPLSVCYRCGTDIIDLAKKIMPTIEASPTAKKGRVDYDASYKSLNTGDMVICRNTAPLVALCMKLLISNKKSYVMGTDISKNLINLVESCKRKTEEFTVENVFARIFKEKEKMIKNISKKEKITIDEAKNSQLIASLTDKISTLEILSKGCIGADELIDKLKAIFSDDTDGICLSTIHKSKGLEADRVFIIHSDLMPSKYAKQDWEIEQERNLEYVAITRAKSLLGYITDFDAYKDIESQDKGKEVQDSQFVGVIGEKSLLILTIVEMKEMNTSFGDTTLYEMTDSNGNLFSKFGSIPERFLISNHAEVEVGSIVEFKGTIKAHKEFRGVKTNVISTISKS
jgi:DNA helicase-2/ATP-dependent DNA helicase PcrA